MGCCGQNSNRTARCWTREFGPKGGSRSSKSDHCVVQGALNLLIFLQSHAKLLADSRVLQKPSKRSPSKPREAVKRRQKCRLQRLTSLPLVSAPLLPLLSTASSPPLLPLFSTPSSPVFSSPLLLSETSRENQGLQQVTQGFMRRNSPSVLQFFVFISCFARCKHTHTHHGTAGSGFSRCLATRSLQNNTDPQRRA